MIVIYPYMNDRHGATELLYSIRSMVKHFRSMTGVVIVGDKPQWYKGDYLPLRDILIRREYSMYNKAMSGARQMGITEFLYNCDDHFALKDFDETIPNYYSGTCGQRAIHSTSGRYRKLYSNCPKEWLNYDIHVPIVMKPFTWVSTSLQTDTPIKTTYGNQAQLKGEPLKDIKFFNGHGYDQIKSIIDGKPFFSTSPFSQNKEMMNVLNELYPEKSNYEK